VIYLDTSTLVKRYVKEKGSEIVQRLFARQEDKVTAKIAYVEALAAFSRRRREGYLAENDYVSLCQRFDSEWEAYVVVELSDEVLKASRRLIDNYPLKGFDAIHLASALLIKNIVKEEVTFTCSDRNLLDAAEKENLNTVNPEEVESKEL
jgi:predicted nucleic acid-binding protein